jgi:uroporphyrinogen III methyltransferase/synthase
MIPLMENDDASSAPASRPGKVYLVGAGPGDPDLITVRGQQLLERCDALVYDALVPPSLVENSPAAEKHYVGKTEGGHAFTQDEITQLLLSLAKRPGGPRRIVRLKGGDPYVFGRGGEEALACRAAGVPFEVVPGVTAGVAAPAYAGVPVTHRSISRGVIFYTGHLAHGNLKHLPWKALAEAGFTLVSYMGVSTVAEIARRLQAEGLAPDTPAMMVQEGTTPGQRSVHSTLGTLAERAEAAGIRPPAVTVVGEVVGLAERIGTQNPRPLAGKTVVLLKAEESGYPELHRLRRLGARVIEVPVVRCAPVQDSEAARSALERIGGDDVVFFTSAVAVRYFGEIWRQLPQRPHPQVFAASPTVRQAVLRHGFEVAGGAGGRGHVAQSLRQGAVPAGRTVWLPRSEAAGQGVPQALQAAGYVPRPVPIYRALPVPLPADVRSLLQGGRADAVLFLSGSCVRAAVEAAANLPGASDVLFGAIGPLAASQAEALGIRCEAIPDRPRVGDLVNTVIASLAPEIAPEISYEIASRAFAQRDL